MNTWPGGPCPKCGEDMPARLVHCRTCRALLNTSLEEDSVEIPQFQPFNEVDASSELPARGWFLLCPECQQELRINKKYNGQRVGCKHCECQFDLSQPDPDLPIKAYYADCPFCEKELRIGSKYAGAVVACKFCSGKLKVLD